MKLIVVLAVLSLFAAACGDDDDDTSAGGDDGAASDDGGDDGAASDDGGDDGAASDDGGDDGAASDDGGDDGAASDDGGEPSGEPIKVMSITPIETTLGPNEEIHEAASVYEQYINDRGGVAGRPLEVLLCDGKGDPNEAAACAREAVSEGVVAIVSHFEYDMSVALPILEEAGIALIGSCCPVTPAEFSSPVNFIFGSTNTMQHAAVKRMADDGCQNPAIVYLDLYLDYLTGLANQAMAHYGVFEDTMQIFSIPAEVGDYSAQAAQATDGTDCIWLSTGQAHTGAFFAAMRTVGGDQRVYGAQGNLDNTLAQEYTDIAAGAVVLNAYPNLVDPVWDEFRSALDTYDHADIEFNSLSGLATWAAYVAFTDIAEMIDGAITAASFLETTRQQDEFQTMWGPTIDLSVAEGPMPGFPRVLNLQVTFDIVSEDGELVPTGEFLDSTDAVQATG